MRTRRLGVSFALLLLTTCLPNAVIAQAASPKTAATSADSTAQKQIIQRGQSAYYSLRALGLDEFQATIKPDWEQVLKDEGTKDPAQLQATLKLLNGIHFTMLLDKDGKVTVSHKTDIEPPTEQARKGFAQIYSGMNQAVSGFFDTWSLFMLTSPFPAVNSEYQLEDLGSQYRLSYKEGDSDVVTLMSKDLIISEIKVNSPQFISTLKPQITKTTQGFMLAGYIADYTPKSGPGAVHLNVKISHAPVNGLQLPTNLVFDGTYDSTSVYTVLAFSEHQVKSH